MITHVVQIDKTEILASICDKDYEPSTYLRPCASKPKKLHRQFTTTRYKKARRSESKNQISTGGSQVPEKLNR
jgi:hypothetical protein